MDKGIYCLIFKNPACSARIGALGEVTFRRGWHVYVGSALGSGGLIRLERHIALSLSRDRRPSWHVDYLSVNPLFPLHITVHAATGERLECRLAGAIGGDAVPGFGCSDCSCTSHLFYRRMNPVREVREAFRSLGLDATTKTLMCQ